MGFTTTATGAGTGTAITTGKDDDFGDGGGGGDGGESTPALEGAALGACGATQQHRLMSLMRQSTHTMMKQAVTAKAAVEFPSKPEKMFS